MCIYTQGAILPNEFRSHDEPSTRFVLHVSTTRFFNSQWSSVTNHGRFKARPAVTVNPPLIVRVSRRISSRTGSFESELRLELRPGGTRARKDVRCFFSSVRVKSRRACLARRRGSSWNSPRDDLSSIHAREERVRYIGVKPDTRFFTRPRFSIYDLTSGRTTVPDHRRNNRDYHEIET